MEFGRIPRLVEFGGIFEYRVSISGNLILIDPSKFSRFWFGV